MSVTNLIDPNDGRNRRKVIFRSDDMNFSDLDESDTQDDNDDESDIGDVDELVNEVDNSDSEWSDTEEENEDKKTETDQSRFYGRSFGKENEIRKKIANELAKLDKINQESNVNKWNEQELDDSDGSIEYDEDSDDEDGSENEKNFEASDENEDLSDIDYTNDEDPKISVTGEFPTNDLQETTEDTTLNWKKNLAQKATNAYYDRQNSVANLWKLVYGK